MRYERKFRVEQVEEGLLRQLILHHPYHFQTAFPDRLVLNIYFDTPEFTCFQENVAGISVRKKFRLRWYQTDWGEKAFGHRWEIKKKENQLGDKETRKLSRIEGNRPIFPGEPQLLPTLMNAYRRSYFLSGCQRFRLTLDHQLGYSLPPHGWPPFPAQSGHFPFHDTAAILELKYAEELDQNIEDLTSYFPFRQTRNSKYVQGVEMVYQ
jgi:SPX domain protein involved in polyphosphate accumulation